MCFIVDSPASSVAQHSKDPEPNLKEIYKSLTKLSQEAQKWVLHVYVNLATVK